ncbi:hypothetical protein [Tenacibaculum sp. IB213877]|uniref:hypothetical protein n=1 Tax=Tenacibaculum sp. IB213877 TaxID=3097351 RepID=UPI002A59B714|nr:hypothetical protein [Tenacibaculum sp. IB213877]MDY0781560.1 hypothetical protein [Tenacibaculum sp. IB213877]
MKKLLFLMCGIMLTAQLAFSQGSPDYTGGLKVKFDEDGKKYLRIISWAQVQGVYNFDAPANTNDLSFNLRRARVLMFAQINSKFLILTHFGLNSLNSNTLSPTGTGAGSQLFFHDVWAQYNLSKNHSVGAGLHYFNGISRLNNQSTLNMMTLDNNRQSWATIGLSDQFARHIGIFAKGKLGKLQYRVAINDAITNSLDGRDPNAEASAVYGGKRVLGSADAGKAYAGYFDYHFLDQESNFLPYKVGSYLGGKEVFNIGAGFFLHPNGSVYNDGGNLVGEDVSIFAIDAFYDAPLGGDGSAITAYAVYQNNDYGTNLIIAPASGVPTYGTGNMLYGHVGYVFAGDKTKTRYQPYVSFSSNSYDAFSDNQNVFGLGINAYMSGHNSKLTLEYKNQDFGTSTSSLTLQAMIYL